MGESGTIIAVCTPRGHGGIGLVRLSGADALAASEGVFQSRQSLASRPRQVTFGHIISPEGGAVDTALAWYLPAPSTYTGECVVEISTHGSDAVLDLVVEGGLRGGARLAEPGEFTRRAFLNGRMDLLQAEAVADVIQAQSQGSLRAAYGVLGGDLSTRVEGLRELLVKALARIESQLDFSEDVSVEELHGVDEILQQAQDEAERLVSSFEGARARVQGFRVVLAGPPNVGKSTLFNALLGEDRSIVTEVPGTTRDWVEATTTWNGETIRLVDTAGLRDTADVIERAGVERTQQQLGGADLILRVSDGTASLPPDSRAGQPGEETRTLHVRSKADQAPPIPSGDLSLAVSSHTGQGLQELQQAITGRMTTHRGQQVGPTRERHKEGLEAICEAIRQGRTRLAQDDAPELAATDLHAGLGHVGDLLGENTDEAVLDRIFSEFCIGK